MRRATLLLLTALLFSPSLSAAGNPEGFGLFASAPKNRRGQRAQEEPPLPAVPWTGLPSGPPPTEMDPPAPAVFKGQRM